MIEPLLSRATKLSVIEGLPCDLWVLNFREIQNYELIHAKKILNKQEFERCEKYQLHDLKARFIISRLLIKSLLALKLNCSPNDIEIQYSELGKPYLLGKHLHCHFSYSDSHNMGLLALSSLYEVGVDFEIVDNNPDVLETLSVIATPSEKEWVLEKDQFQRYYLLWTMKESYLKCLGTGLQGPLPEVSAIMIKPIGGIHLLPGEPSLEIYSNHYNDYIYSLSIRKH